MNRKRTNRNLNFGSIVFLVVVAVVLAAAGVFHAYIKNQQVEVARRTEKTEQRISQHELDIKTLQMHMEQQLIRPLIWEKLRRRKSKLVKIPINEVEKIDANPLSNPLPDLARRGP
jgi:hypothetical protein